MSAPVLASELQGPPREERLYCTDSVHPGGLLHVFQLIIGWCSLHRSSEKVVLSVCFAPNQSYRIQGFSKRSDASSCPQEVSERRHKRRWSGGVPPSAATLC